MVATTSGNKTDQIYAALRGRLIDGHYQFGEVLSTYELAQEFGVSRRPVLDAATRLAVAGFMEIIPQVGCQVAIPDATTVREHFAVAGILEGAAARLAAMNAVQARLREITRALERCAVPAAAEDRSGFATANRQFHAAVLSAGGNSRLSELATRAWDLSDFYLRRGRGDADLRTSQSEHSDIAGAILRGEPGLARELMEAHLTRFGTNVQL